MHIAEMQLYYLQRYLLAVVMRTFQNGIDPLERGPRIDDLAYHLVFTDNDAAA